MYAVTTLLREDSYCFGFQGQEKDDEIHGATGTSYAFEYRMHDPRVGRFLSIDPLAAKYPFYSPYAFSGNRVIDRVELEGLEPAPAVSGDEVEGQTTTTTTESYARGGVHNTRTWSWTFHEGGVNGTTAGWMLDDDYAEDVVKPLAKDYIAWEDGTGNGDLWTGFSVDRGGGWGEAISQAADYQRANPTYDGWKSYIPIWGSANQAALDFSVGKYGSGTFNTVLAATDVFLVRSIVSVPLKMGVEAGRQSYARFLSRNLLNGKNSVTLWDDASQLSFTRYDLLGAAHGGIGTPHSLRYGLNLGARNGQFFASWNALSKGRLPSSMGLMDLGRLHYNLAFKPGLRMPATGAPVLKITLH